jgi:putative hydrolase of the HAD superfamily
MVEPDVTHVLFDFFGTLVEYSPSRTEQGYSAVHALVQGMGVDLGYEQFLDEWTAESAGFDQRSAADDSEFSMAEVATAFLSRVLARAPTSAEVDELVDTYLREWNTAVIYPASVPKIVEALAERFGLAVVSNTHQPGLVTDQLAAMGIADRFEAVITSVELGRRKPHPIIYAEALTRLGITAANAVFVGDTYLPDYTGPQALGITAYLIDPGQQHDLPAEQRLRSLADLPERLGVGTPAGDHSAPRLGHRG